MFIAINYALMQVVTNYGRIYQILSSCMHSKFCTFLSLQMFFWLVEDQTEEQ
jgi:hypothetical protein